MGIAVDQNGRPVPKAIIQAGHSFQMVREIAGEDGRFLIDLEQPHPFFLLVHARTADRKQQAYFHFSQKGPLGKGLSLKLVLKPARTLTVNVVDANGAPVPDATVEALAQLSTIGTTNEAGVATILLPPDEPVDWVIALKNGVGFDYYENQGERPALDVLPLPDTISLVLDGARTVEVRTADPSDQPISDLGVRPWLIVKNGKRRNVNLSASEAASVTTNAEGIARFNWLPATAKGRITFITRSTKYHLPEWGRLDSGAETLDMFLNPTVRATGKVTFPDGKPAAGILLQAEGRGATPNYGRHHTRTAADGSYAFDLYPQLTYLIAVIDDEWAASLDKIDVTPDRLISGLDVKLQNGTLVRGTASLPPDTHPGLSQITFIQEGQKGEFGTPELVRWISPDADGRYLLRLGRGDYSFIGPRADPRRVERSLRISNEQEIVRNFP
jgi:hypothetical protein